MQGLGGRLADIGAGLAIGVVGVARRAGGSERTLSAAGAAIEAGQASRSRQRNGPALVQFGYGLDLAADTIVFDPDLFVSTVNRTPAAWQSRP